MHLNNIFLKVKNNSNFRNGILFTLFAFLNNGLNFFLLLILARYLAPEGYGTLNLFNTTITILTILVPLGTVSYVSVSFFKKEYSEFKKVLNTVFILSFISLLLLFTLLLACYSFLSGVLGFSIEFQIISLLICFFQVFNLVNLDIWRLEEKPVKYGIYSLCVVLLNFGLTLLLVLSYNMDWEGRVYAQLSVAIIFFFISIFFLIHRGFLKFHKWKDLPIKETLSFGVPLIPHQISNWLRQGIDRYIINYFVSTASVGLFGFAFNFANIIHMIGIAFNASNSVFIYKNLKDDNIQVRKKLKEQTRFMCLLFTVITVLVLVGAYIFIPYIFPKYIDSIPFLFPLCLGALFQCIYYLFVNYLFYFKKTKGLMYITASVSILHLILSFIFTRYSTLFTAYITLFSNFVICALVIVYSQKIYPIYSKKK